METKEREHDELVDLSDLVLPVLARWKLLLAMALLGAVVAFAVSRALPKTYQATAVVYPKQSRAGADFLRGLPIAIGGDSGGSGYLITVLQSETLCRSVLDKLRLARDRRFTGGRHMTAEDALAALKRMVDIREARNGSITIVVQARNPYLAARIANALLDGLDRMVVRTSKRKTDFISEKLAATSRDLEKAEDRLLAFHERNDIALLDEETKGLINQLTELDARLLVIDVDLQGVKSELENAGDLSDLVDLQVRLKALEASRQYVLDTRERLQNRMAQLPGIAAEYGRLKRNVAVLTKTYEVLTEQYQLARITQQGEDGDYQIVDRALPKTRKIAPRNAANAVAGGVLGGVLGLTVLTLHRQSRIRRRVRGTRDAG